MIFSVFSDLNSEENLSIVFQMLSVLENSDCRIFFSDEYSSLLSDKAVELVPYESLMQICDIAIAIGGDGTTVKIAKHAAIFGKPTLGINGGRLGFLSGIERNELELLRLVADGSFKVDERMMLKADIIESNKPVKTFHCLNDAVFSRGDFARLIDIKINCDGREIWNVRADGVIISTPTGSTAYNLAAGGPVLSPDMQCFVITSICPHSLMDRSIVVSSRDILDIKISSDVSNNSIITCDGEEPVEITASTVVKVSLSPYKARLIKVKPDNFYEVLKKKIIERRI